MLDGQPAVFLSCSDKFKQRVAVPVRTALAEHGVHGIIVSEEPLLPRTPTDPDSKVNSYLDASDAVVALCTPDDQLGDGTVQCRQNVIDEIQRARSRPGLCHKIQVLKAPAVRLPSNINPTYDRLDVDDVSPTVEAIVTQLRTWGVLAREAEPAPAQLTEPATVDDMIEGLGLGEHDKATQHAYALLLTETRESQIAVVDRLVRFLRETSSDGGDEVHRASSVLEAIHRLDPSLVSIDVIEQMASSSDHAKRMSAAMMLWDRAEVAPDDVPLGLLGRLARPSAEDWYVQAPAMAATKLLLLRRRSARVVFDTLALIDSDNRYAVAAALLDVATVDPRRCRVISLRSWRAIAMSSWRRRPATCSLHWVIERTTSEIPEVRSAYSEKPSSTSPAQVRQRCSMRQHSTSANIPVLLATSESHGFDLVWDGYGTLAFIGRHVS